MKQLYNIFSNRYFPFIIIVATIVLKSVYAMGLEIHPDEAYYWDWSRHLDFSYYDQGPGVGLYIRFFTVFFGNTYFALKVAALFASIVIPYLIYRIAIHLKLDPFRAAIAMLIVLFAPGLFSGSVLIMHDTVLILFWTLALYFAVRYLDEKRDLWMLLLFVSLGAGFLGKYTMVFFGAGLVVWLIFEREEWGMLRKPSFWTGILLGLAIVSVVIYWNLTHDGASVEAILYLRSSGGGAKTGSTAGYIAGQFLSFSPVWQFLFLVVIFTFAYRGLLKIFSMFTGRTFSGEQIRSSAYRLVLVNSLVLPLFFLYLSYSRIVQPNWLIPSYPAMAILLASLLPSAEEVNSGLRKRLYAWTLYAGFLPSLLLIFYTFHAGDLYRLGFIPGKVDYIPEYRAGGYRQAILDIERIGRETAPDALMAATRYQDAALAGFYMKDQPFIPSINVMQKNQYSFWPYLQEGKDYIIFIIYENECQKSGTLLEPVLNYMFDSVEILQEGTVTKDGLLIKRHQMWLARNFKQRWDMMLVNYLNRAIIYDIMPNLAGKRGKVRGASDKETSEFNKMMGGYDRMQKEDSGCSFY